MNISPQRLKELEAIPEDAIDTDHIPELDDSFWSKAKMVAPRTIAMSNEHFGYPSTSRSLSVAEVQGPRSRRAGQALSAGN